MIWVWRKYDWEFYEMFSLLWFVFYVLIFFINVGYMQAIVWVLEEVPFFGLLTYAGAQFLQERNVIQRRYDSVSITYTSFLYMKVSVWLYESFINF